MILCDTNILIEFYKNNERIVLELRQIRQNRLGISHITQAELYFGALDKPELIKKVPPAHGGILIESQAEHT